MKTNRQNKMLFYSLNDFDDSEILDAEFISFFSEVASLGVIGSLILDRIPHKSESVIKYKHRLLYAALDSYYLLRMLEAIEKRESLRVVTRLDSVDDTINIVHLKILLNQQNGREYAACFDIKNQTFRNCRLDQIVSVESMTEEYDKQTFEVLQRTVDVRLQNTWNVNFYHHENPQKVELVLYVDEEEPFILTRLQREGHGGRVDYRRTSISLSARSV